MSYPKNRADYAERRQAKLIALGPKPPWWRPFARRRWRREWVRIVSASFDEYSALIGDIYNDDYIRRLAERPNAIVFGVDRKP